MTDEILEELKKVTNRLETVSYQLGIISIVLGGIIGIMIGWTISKLFI